MAIPQNRPLAIFCDFDGTFSVQDVGSTLAQQLLPEKRARLWNRFAEGEFTAWTYAMALLDGLELPEKDLDAFLETIDLDPGAETMLEWCAAEGVPFRILSDGFDWNLDRLQAMNRIEFEHDANHLEYEGDLWKLSPGRPNAACGCGTGSCKRGLIQAYRDAHPDAFCVHIGNGRVSDLCGALEADLAFAKDTLAPALEELGREFQPFDTLHDVLDVLRAERGTLPAAEARTVGRRSTASDDRFGFAGSGVGTASGLCMPGATGRCAGCWSRGPSRGDRAGAQ